MEVKIEVDPAMVGPPNVVTEFAQSCYFRENVFVQLIKLSIKVLAAVTGPKIARYDSIWVQHGHNIENKHRAQNIRRLAIF